MKRFLTSLVLLLLLAPMLGFSQEVEMADVLRNNGKIYVVVGVIAIIFIGLFVYLVAFDIRFSKAEKEWYRLIDFYLEKAKEQAKKIIELEEKLDDVTKGRDKAIKKVGFVRDDLSKAEDNVKRLNAELEKTTEELRKFKEEK